MSEHEPTSGDANLWESAAESSDWVRAEGARLARSVADELGGSLAGDPQSDRSGPPEPDELFSMRDLLADFDRALDANMKLLRQILDVYARTADRVWRTSSSAGAASGDGLVFPPVLPGHVATSTMWLHNTTDATAGPYSIVPGSLTSASGAEIPAKAFTIEPDETPAIPPGTSYPLAVALWVDLGSEPGSYRGRLQVEESPSEELVVSVDVIAPPD